MPERQTGMAVAAQEPGKVRTGERKLSDIKQNDELISKQWSSIADYMLTSGSVVEHTVPYRQNMNDSYNIQSERQRDIRLISA